METVCLKFKQSIYEPNEPIEYVYFVKHGVASVLLKPLKLLKPPSLLSASKNVVELN
jgi:hypothetical protein